MEFDLENPFTNFQEYLFNDDDSETILASLFVIESDHMPSESYIKTLKARDPGAGTSIWRDAVVLSSILHVSYKFDPFVSYLAVNYMDRFLSSQEMPQPKPWMLRLLAVSCFSLAAKMRQVEFSVTDFQGDGVLIFDTQTIQRTEYLILGALKWRMRSITPFSFISFFISLFHLKDPPPLQQSLKTRATEIIFKAQIDIKVLEFKPSIIAASALLIASRELYPLQFPCFRKAISSCSFVHKENMLQCYKAMQQETSTTEEHESEIDLVVSSSYTPVNVLDRRFSISESDKTTNATTTTNTITISTPLSPERDTKRRKMSGYCNNRSIQLSQTEQC